MLTRRGFLGGILVAGVMGQARPAAASIARAMTVNELVLRSRHVVLGTPVDAFCRWERVGRRRRIVTYSLVQVHAPLDGRAPATSEVMVRTLGGSVGDDGQIVHGEAELALGERAAVFLSDVSADLFRVTAMSQGHYPTWADTSQVERLRAGLGSLELIEAPGAAVHQLDGRTLVEAERLLGEELRRGAR